MTRGSGCCACPTAAPVRAIATFALLHLLGSAGLRRAEVSAVLVGDVDERRRSSDPRLRHAIKGSTSWWVTFCTHLADSGADTAVIRELAGHADIRTTTIYTAVSDARLEHAIEARSLQHRGARRAAAAR